VRTFTIAEAAEATGLTKKAVRNRVDRGQLRAVLNGGVRRVPLSELVRAGLLDENGQGHNPAPGQPRPQIASVPAPAEAPFARELFDRLERQARELGELRALTREAESVRNRERQERERADRLESELFEARARVAELEARRRRWFGLRAAS
jgi:excisionase family DNA binding protein